MTSTVDYRGDQGRRAEGKSLTWRARQPVVPLAKRLLRSIAMATADRRQLPDFLLIGAKRGGSTSIYRNLVGTPGLVGLHPRRADIKGTYFFDVEYQRGHRWYRSHFASDRQRAAHPDLDGSPALCGEASPYYLSHPHAPRRAAALAPEARIIVALRDPVARAHSHYTERVRQKVETLPSFADAVSAEPARLAGEWDRMLDDPSYVSAAHLNFGYLAQSRYEIGLLNWLDAYPGDRVLVVRSEDFYADERQVLSEIRSFLGLAPTELPEPTHYNDTGNDRLDPGLQSELRARLAPSIEATEQLLGRSMRWT